MGDALKGLLSELEACRGESVARHLLIEETGHAMQMPMDAQTCHELKALADVFACEPAHLALVVLKTALSELHAGLDDDLAQLARDARQRIAGHCH